MGAQEDGLSSKAMVGICAIATGLLLLAGLGIAAGCGAFSSKKQQAYHHQHHGVNHQNLRVPSQQQIQQPVQQPVRQPVVEDSVADSDEPVEVKPEDIKRHLNANDLAAQRAELKKVRDEILDLPVSTASYERLKQVIDWIRLKSYWSMIFSKTCNKHAWDLMKPSRAGIDDIKRRRKGWFFGRKWGWFSGSSALTEINQWKAIVKNAYNRRVQLVSGPSVTREQLDRALWIDEQHAEWQMINDIYNHGNLIRNKGLGETLWWNERVRKTFWKFHGYCRSIDLMRDVVSTRISLREDAGGLNPEFWDCDYNVLNDGSWLWRDGDILPGVVQRKRSGPNAMGDTPRQDTHFQYLRDKRFAIGGMSLKRSDRVAIAGSFGIGFLLWVWGFTSFQTGFWCSLALIGVYMWMFSLRKIKHWFYE